VKEFIENPDKINLFKKLKIAFYITGGLALILAVIPQLLLSFKPFDQAEGVNALSQAMNDSATANAAASALVKDRTNLEQADAWRALVFIVISFGLLWAFVKQKVNVTLMSIGFLALILVDMWQVDKRYLKESSFQEKQDVAQAIQPREVDVFIMKDKDPNFRVFDMSDLSGLKMDTYSPFFHKSIGGYSAARLKRYEELLDNQFSRSVNQDVLDMLNTKYIITTDQKTGQASMQANSTACGHAWFVSSVKYVKNSDEEMKAISSFDPKNEAMVDEQYKKLVESKTITAPDPNATIKLVKYNPDHLEYQSSSATNQVAIFSEIYYNKGWKMSIDGVEQPYYRADYLLRAATIPLGNHVIKFDFHPTSYYTGEGISMAGSILLVLALGGAVFMETKKKKTAKA
jgi:uncharacterized membrane protein YfhO